VGKIISKYMNVIALGHPIHYEAGVLKRHGKIANF